MLRAWYCLNGSFYVYYQDRDPQWPYVRPIRLRRPLGYGSPPVVHRTQRLGAHGAIGRGHDYLRNTNPTTILGALWSIAPEQSSTAVRWSVPFLHNDQPTASLAVWTYIVPSEAMQHAVLLGRDRWMRFSECSYRTLLPRPSDNRVLGNSPYRTNIQVEPLLSPLIFRPRPVVVTSFTEAIEASRSHATTNSSQFPWYAVTAPQPWPAAILWICFTAPLIFQPTRTSSKTVYNRSHLPA